MISYKPFFDLLKKRGISQYDIIENDGISSSTIYRLRHDLPVTTTTLETLCITLDCDVNDIVIISRNNTDKE